MELGAHFSVHSVTKYLSGHGDVLGGAVIADAEHYPDDPQAVAAPSGRCSDRSRAI